MAHWKLTLSYDGTSFHGWQIQPGLSTIQGTLAEALHRITGESVLPQGSGRTDAGVHALAQVASVTLAADIPPPNLQRALNSVLPPSVRILAAGIAAADFHARHSALRKTYEYRLFERRLADEAADRICPPFLSPYAWPCRWPLNLADMSEAASLLLGKHDFASFAASDPDRTARSKAPALLGHNFNSAISKPIDFVASATDGLEQAPENSPLDSSPASKACNTRIIHASTFTRTSDLLTYRITGNGFLHHMVRNIVGTLVDVGRGALTPAQFHEILAARDRTEAGPTAPAQGLFLVSVEYLEPPR